MASHHERASQQRYDRIMSSLNKHLGQGSDQTVIKTLNLVYKIGEEEVRSNPAMLEEKLGRLLGDRTAEPILKDAKTRKR